MSGLGALNGRSAAFSPQCNDLDGWLRRDVDEGTITIVGRIGFSAGTRRAYLHLPYSTALSVDRRRPPFSAFVAHFW